MPAGRWWTPPSAATKTPSGRCIQKKTDVNAAEPDGTTALHWAAYRDDLESADLLLKAGAKANAANDLGATPLWNASQNGSVAMVKRLLDAGANPNLALLAGETPVMVAARSGYPEVVEVLLAKGGNPNAHGTRGQTALMWAVSQQHPAVVKVLIAHGVDLKARSDVYNEVMAVPPHGYLPYNLTIPHGGETALMFAARVGDLESAKLLVAAGANVNDADAWGVSATTLAEHSGFSDLVLFLLDKGADPNAASNGFTALHEAIERRDEKVVAALLDHHADPNFPVKTFTPTRRSSDDFHFEPQLVGATPYWMAARFTEPNVMRLLVKHGADPKFVHHADWVGEQGFGGVQRKENVNAADGRGGNAARESLGRSGAARSRSSHSGKREAGCRAGRRPESRQYRWPHRAGRRQGVAVPVGGRLSGREGRQAGRSRRQVRWIVPAGMRPRRRVAGSSAGASARANRLNRSAPSVRLDSAFDLYNTTQ